MKWKKIIIDNYETQYDGIENYPIFFPPHPTQQQLQWGSFNKLISFFLVELINGMVRLLSQSMGIKK